MTRDQLIKDYAAIIDQQKEEIDLLKQKLKFEEPLETIELTDIPKNATILPCGLEIWQTEDLFIILKDSQDSVAFEKKHLPDLVDALIELQNI
jgi:hypothetical protein